MIKKPAIPPYSSSDKTLTQVLNAVRENIEIMTGVRNGTSQINQLPPAATNAEIVVKLNEIIAALNYSGR
jgi:hypothetical protein